MSLLRSPSSDTSPPSGSSELVKFDSPTAVVYLEYADVEALAIPPKPSDAWTRFVCISDTHTRTFPCPNGDVLLHSGDLTESGTLSEFETTMDWLRSLPHAHKILIAGNHDLTLHEKWYSKNYRRWHREPQELEPILDLLTGPAAKNANIVYLQDETYQFRSKDNGRLWTVYGSPWSPYFCNWGFNYRRGAEAKTLINAFPHSDILLTHGPPYGIFDTTEGGDKVGCEVLAERLASLQPRLHVFGHIHEGHDAKIHDWPLAAADVKSRPSVAEQSGRLATTGRTVFVNAANWPAGPRLTKVKNKPEFGGVGFRPVVVDLLDSGPSEQ